MSSEMLERIAKAFDEADVGYHMELTRLVDGVHTYTLIIAGQVLEFHSTDELYDHVTKVKNRIRALAVMKAMREPTETMMTAAAKAGDVAIQNGELWPGRDSAGLVLSAAFDAEISLAEGGKDD